MATTTTGVKKSGYVPRNVAGEIKKRAAQKAEEKAKKKKVRSVQNICCSLFRALSCLSDLELF
jgi:hypothetical protein